MAGEPFDIKKWVKGFIDPTTWSKSVVYFIMIFVILVIIFTIYRAYFMKTGSNISRPWVIGLPGSKIGDIDMSANQKVEKERKWWQPIPYISVYGEVRGNPNVSLNNMDTGYGVQGGLRWDFN